MTRVARSVAVAVASPPRAAPDRGATRNECARVSIGVVCSSVASQSVSRRTPSRATFAGEALDTVVMSSSVVARSRACVVNARRLNFDGELSFDELNRVLGDVSGGAVTTHDDASPSVEDIARRCVGHDVLISKEVPVDVTLLPPSVRLICEAGTGFNNIDVSEAKKRGILVCNVPTYSTDAVAQLVLSFLHASSLGLCEQYAALRAGCRDAFRDDFSGLKRYEMYELKGRTIGLVGGTGAIGRRVARLCRELGMRVLCWSRSAKTEEGLWEAVGFDALMMESDFVSIHCPLNDSTRGLIDARAIGLMKPTAKIINTARGAVINEKDLIDALETKKIAGACLDVQETEPPVEDSPLWGMVNVYLTPHIGWKRVETRQRLIDTVASNVAAFLDSKPVNVVEP